MTGMFNIEIIGAQYAEAMFGTALARMPQMLIEMPMEAKEPVMQRVMGAMWLNTPVGEVGERNGDPGQLRALTNWQEVSQGPDGLNIEVFSDAVNTRTGYEYAKARAYGFNPAFGSGFWSPPEDPPYPEAAADQAFGLIEDIGTPIAYALNMRLFNIPH